MIIWFPFLGWIRRDELDQGHGGLLVTDTTQWGEVAALRSGRKEQTDRDSLGEALQCRDVHWGKKQLP